jgi:hypothetical protein
MKMTLLLTTVVGVALATGCKKSEPEKPAAAPAAPRQAEAPKPTAAPMQLAVAKEVEAGCAMCIYGMADASCELAVKIDDKVYLVEGSKLDDHGDAHAPDGMCMIARTAYVEGRIEGHKFIAQKFELRK